MSTSAKKPFPHILYEDESLLVIDKPAGMSVHGDGISPETTVADLVLAQYPKTKNVGEQMEVMIKGQQVNIARPGIVHRLDKDTTGCLIVAKTQEAFTFLKEQFMEHKVAKTYRAFTYGTPKEDGGTITAPIGRSGSGVRKWATDRSSRDKVRDAVTEYRVLARIGLDEDEARGSTKVGTYAYVEAKPRTGRTHQIRVHMKHLNHPIVADRLYAGHREAALGFTRLALHAYQLSFILPTGKPLTVTAPLPSDFVSACAVAGIDRMC